jgi:DNA-binding NarL/FixJ family response regulator
MGTLRNVLSVGLPAPCVPDTHLTWADAGGDRTGVRATDATTRVLLVEDQRTLAEALMIAIDAQPDMRCVGTAATAEEGVRLARAHRPDVVLMDIHLPGADGITGTRRVKATCPDARVFVLTADATPETYAEATSAGATGFLAKVGPLPDVLAAIRTPPESRALLAGGTFAALATDRRGGNNWAALTERESEVLELLRQRFGTRLIAQCLGISDHTARSHIKRVLTKLQVHSRREAVAVATRTGLLTERR